MKKELLVMLLKHVKHLNKLNPWKEIELKVYVTQSIAGFSFSKMNRDFPTKVDQIFPQTVIDNL